MNPGGSHHDAIRNLLARIAYLADHGTPEAYLECFSEDAVWQLSATGGLPVQPTRLAGKAALLQGVIERRAAGFQGPGTFTAHAISTTSIQLGDAHATAQSLFMYYTGIDGTPTLAAIGRYADTLVADQAGAWLLTHRIITRE